MPPKQKKKDGGGSKKTVQKKKEKLLEDKTFGMKNKNKSKKVQQHIQSITQSVMNSGDPKQRKADEQRKALKMNAKLQKKALEDERNALFGEALLAVSKKKSTDKSSGKIDAKGRDGNIENTKTGTSRAMKMMFQMDAQEMEEKLREDPNYVPTVEDDIEQQRQQMFARLKSLNKTPTKITHETFQQWLMKKKTVRAEQAKRLVETEMKKKKGGKGLSVLTGRDLYSYNQSLFIVQDDDDDDNIETIDVTTLKKHNNNNNNNLAGNVDSNLFLEGDDDDGLDDLSDDDDGRTT